MVEGELGVNYWDLLNITLILLIITLILLIITLILLIALTF
jgi:hypothetical protein